MPRSVNSVAKEQEKIMKLAKGYFGRRKTLDSS
jgi:ribosomal protein L20